MNVVLFSFMDPIVSYGASLSSSSLYAIGPNSVYNSRQRTEGHSAAPLDKETGTNQTTKEY